MHSQIFNTGVDEAKLPVIWHLCAATYKQQSQMSLSATKVVARKQLSK